MTELFINKAKTVAVSGHRSLSADFDKSLLKSEFLNLIKNGYDTFLVGMAVGFDTECFKLLQQIKNEKDIKIIACIPCLNQDINFSINQKRQYKEMVENADGKIILQEKYDKYCMLKRNNFMVDNCSVLVAYLRKNTGGTAYTVNYANKKSIPVIKI